MASANCAVSKNVEENGIEIKFPSIPPETIRTELKSKGFRWSGFNKVWWKKYDTASWAWAQQFCGDNPEAFAGIGETPSDLDAQEATGDRRQAIGDGLTFEQKVFLNFVRMHTNAQFRSTNIFRTAVYFDTLTKRAFFVVLAIRPYKSYGDEKIRIEKVFRFVDEPFWNSFSDTMKDEAYTTVQPFVTGKLSGGSGEKFEDMIGKPNLVRIDDYGIKSIPRKYQGKAIDFKNLKLSKHGRYSNKYLLSLEILLGKIGVATKMYFDGMDDSHRYVSNPTPVHFAQYIRDNSFEDYVLGGFDDVRINNAYSTVDKAEYFVAGNSAHTYMLKYISDKVDLYGDTERPKISQNTEGGSDKATGDRQQATGKAIAEKFYKTAESLRKKGNDKKKSLSNANTNTPKRQRDYNASSIDADILLEKAAMYEAIGKAYEAGTLPDVLRDISPTIADDQLHKFVLTSEYPSYYVIYRSDKRHFEKNPTRYPDAPEQWAAIQQLLGGKAIKSEADLVAEKIRKAEDELRFSKIEGFFPTPKKVIEKMLDYAKINDGDKVLEPSAGKGDIAEAIRKEYPTADLDVCERMYSLREILKLKGFNVVGDDTLALKGQYDKILMNPPFEGGQDIEHVRYCYDNLLAPGGSLVSVMSRSYTFNSQTKFKNFREWLTDQNSFDEQLPDGSFSDAKEAFKQTGVATNILVIEKPFALKAVKEDAPSVSDTDIRKMIAHKAFFEMLIDNINTRHKGDNVAQKEEKLKSTFRLYGYKYDRETVKKIFYVGMKKTKDFEEATAWIFDDTQSIEYKAALKVTENLKNGTWETTMIEEQNMGGTWQFISKDKWIWDDLKATGINNMFDMAISGNGYFSYDGSTDTYKFHGPHSKFWIRKKEISTPSVSEAVQYQKNEWYYEKVRDLYYKVSNTDDKHVYFVVFQYVENRLKEINKKSIWLDAPLLQSIVKVEKPKSEIENPKLDTPSVSERKKAIAVISSKLIANNINFDIRQDDENQFTYFVLKNCPPTNTITCEPRIVVGSKRIMVDGVAQNANYEFTEVDAALKSVLGDFKNLDTEDEYKLPTTKDIRRSAYQEKVDNRRERFENKAAKLENESEAQWQRSTDLSQAFYGGQPILVGHHSEKPARARQEKMHNAMSKSVEASEKANYYADKAASVGKGGISSDNPDALDELREKLAKMEAEQEMYKKINQAYRNFVKKPASLDTADLSDKMKETIRNFTPEWSKDTPIPDFKLKNNNGNMARVRERIAELEAKEAKYENGDKEYHYEAAGLIVTENIIANRLQFRFDEIPEKAIREKLAKAGLRWSPSEKAWQRHLRENNAYAVKEILDIVGHGNLWDRNDFVTENPKSEIQNPKLDTPSVSQPETVTKAQTQTDLNALKRAVKYLIGTEKEQAERDIKALERAIKYLN
jgi:hypothetical protein